MAINAGTVVAYLTLEANPFFSSLERAEKELKKVSKESTDTAEKFNAFGKAMTDVGATMTKYITIPLLALSGYALKVGADFEDSMAMVQAKSQATTEEMRRLEEEARRLGGTTRFSAKEAADGMTYLAAAGFNANQIIASMPGMLDLAASEQMDLARAADITSDVMSMFQISTDEATKTADIFALTSAKTNTNVEMLGEALKYCGSSAHGAGMSLAQTNAILGVFANNGIKGSMAGTTLNMMLSDMINKAENGKIAIGNFKVALYNNNGEMRDMTRILDDIIKKTRNMTQAQRDAALSAVFGERSLRGLNIIMQQGTDAIKELEKSLESADGYASQAAKTVENTLGGSLRNLNSAFEETLLIIKDGIGPTFQALVNGLTNVLRWFNGLNETVQAMIIGFAGALAIIGPFLLTLGVLSKTVSILKDGMNLFNTFVDLACTGASKLTGIFTAQTAAMVQNGVAMAGKRIAMIADTIATGAATVAQMALNMAVAAFPYMIIVIGIAAIIAAVYALVKHWSTVTQFFRSVWAEFQRIGQGINQTIGQIGNGIKSAFQNIIGTITNMIKSIINSLISIINVPLNILNAIKIPIPPFLGGGVIGFDIKPIPLLAEGGIATKATLGIFGEAGDEAILPLSKLDGIMERSVRKALDNNSNQVSSNNDLDSRIFDILDRFEKLIDSTEGIRQSLESERRIYRMGRA